MDPEVVRMIEIAFYTLQILAMLGGGGMILIKMGRMMGAFETIGKQQATEIGQLKDEVKSLNVLITTVAVQKAEMASMREEIGQLRRWYDELRHGIGLVRQVS